MTRLFSGINSLLLCVSLILVSLSLTHLFLHPSHRLPLLFHHSQRPKLLHSFTPDLKSTCFGNPSRCRLPFLPQNWFHGLSPGSFLLGYIGYCFSSFSYFFLFLAPCARLSWLVVGFSAHVKYFVSCCIVSYFEKYSVYFCTHDVSHAAWTLENKAIRSRGWCRGQCYEVDAKIETEA